MATYKKINIASTGGGGGGGGSAAIYEQTFSSGDFSLVSGNYRITVTEAVHQMTATNIVFVQELVGSNYRDIGVDIFVDGTTGDVSFEVSQTPDLRFTGRILIVGG
jgi:hypothetical protein